MKVTLKKAKQIVEDIVDGHAQIREFGEGNPFQINSNERKFPLAWMDFTPSLVTRNQVQLRFRIYVMDLVDQADAQLLDVKSNSMLQLNDILKELRTTEELINENMSYTFTPFEHDFNGDVAGWWTEVTLDIENIYGPCDVPQ